MRLCHIHGLIFTFKVAIESYECTDYGCFIHFEKNKTLTILEPKQEKKIFKKIFFFCKMLIFQDFSKFLKILKSAVQYLCRDISNVKIGLYLRSSHKKDWKTHFGPTALKNQKIEKRKQWCIIIFLYLSGKKKFRKSDHRSYAFGHPPKPSS